MGLLDSLAMGLRGAGGTLNKQVYGGIEQEQALAQRNDQAMRALMTQQIIKGIESGSIDPQQGQQQLRQLTGMDVPVGMDPMQQEKIQAVKDQVATRRFIQENAKFFVDEQGNFSPRKMISFLATKDPSMAANVAKGLGVDFEQKPMVVPPESTVLDANGKEIFRGSPKERITWSEPYSGPDGTLFQKSSDGQIRTVLGREPRVTVHNPAPVSPVTIVDEDPKSPTYGRQIVIDGRTRQRLGLSPGDTKQVTAFNQDTASYNSMISSLDRLGAAANEVYNHNGLGGITGLRGAVPNIPGSAAANAEAKLNTLKSQVGFMVLQEMRNNSKTGGALGQVSDFENKMLQSNLDSLEKAQDYEQMRGSLKNIIDYSEKAKGRFRSAYNMKWTDEGAPNRNPNQTPVGPKKVTSQAEYDALPSGSEYISPDGKTRRKK